jgi:uncharacterized protein (TIGR02145 family)
MSIYIGSQKANKIYMGSSDVKSVYIGSQLYFNSAAPPVIETVTIGSQVWMKYNVDTNVTGEVYGNDESNRALYGGLYSFDQCAIAAAQYPGFHIPSQLELSTLAASLVGDPAYKLRETGITYWNNANGTNTVGWGARGGGADYGGFYYQKDYAFFWTTEYSGNWGLDMYIHKDNYGVNFGYDMKMYSFSLRLIKD